MKAYTYTIRHIPTDKLYYGVKKSCIFDLGISYFSSSKLVKRLIFESSIEDFEFKLRKKFNSYEEARLHETKLLKRINAVNNDKMLNQAISSPRVCSKDILIENERRKKISKSMKGNQNLPRLSKEEHSRRGKLGAQKRSENIKSGKTTIKRKSSDFVTNWILEKDGKEKIVKPSSVPAYLKCGYQKVRKIKTLK